VALYLISLVLPCPTYEPLKWSILQQILIASTTSSLQLALFPGS